MDLEGIMLSETSQTKTNIVSYHLYVESKKCNKLVNITKNKQAQDIENKLVVTSGGCQYRGGGVRGTNYWV